VESAAARGRCEPVTFSGLPPVDRRPFIPNRIVAYRDIPYERWTERQRETMEPGETLSEQFWLSREENPGEWDALVSSDGPIVTHLRNGQWARSSSSSPGAMAKMIDVAGVEAGMRVLEIGTGTGYNAACLSALGTYVVSVEVDPEIVERARRNLRAAGYPEVVVVTGDGLEGAPDHAPFDRVIA
jgi:protein-L-isoaspartate(D-aspartate) O-methyltransferase